MTWDIRYFYIDTAAEGLVFNGTSMTIPLNTYTVVGEVGGAEFGNLTEVSAGQFRFTAGTSTLTAPSGLAERVIAAQLWFYPQFSAEGTALPNPGTVSVFLLESGALAMVQLSSGSTLNGVLPDTVTMAGTVSGSLSFSFTAANFTSSFGGAAGMTCFVAGTLIATPSGPVPVETLCAGDLVLTRDHGAQPVRWAGRQAVTAARLASALRLRPVRIAAGALGPGVPADDLWVSQQHRVLLAGGPVRRFGCAEVLAAAKHLTGLPGVDLVCPDGGITYHHLLFDRHEIVQAGGAWAESLFTGPMALKLMPAAQRAEILTLFPGLAAGTAAHAAPARRFLTGAEARALGPALQRRQSLRPPAALPFAPIAPKSERAACAGAPDA